MAPLHPAMLALRWTCIGVGGEIEGSPGFPHPCLVEIAKWGMHHLRQVRGVLAGDSARKPLRRLRALHSTGRQHFFQALAIHALPELKGRFRDKGAGRGQHFKG